MTEVTFHFNVPDRTGYTCRLVRKALSRGAAVVLAGPPDALDRLDQALWAFDELEFLPHARLAPGAAIPERLAPTRVWLAEEASQPGCHDVLVNLGESPARGFESFEKLIEIVSGDETERAAARRRWKHYADRGYEIRRHDVANEVRP